MSSSTPAASMTPSVPATPLTAPHDKNRVIVENPLVLQFSAESLQSSRHLDGYFCVADVIAKSLGCSDSRARRVWKQTKENLKKADSFLLQPDVIRSIQFLRSDGGTGKAMDCVLHKHLHYILSELRGGLATRLRQEQCNISAYAAAGSEELEKAMPLVRAGVTDEMQAKMTQGLAGHKRGRGSDSKDLDLVPSWCVAMLVEAERRLRISQSEAERRLRLSQSEQSASINTLERRLLVSANANTLLQRDISLLKRDVELACLREQLAVKNSSERAGREKCRLVGLPRPEPVADGAADQQNERVSGEATVKRLPELLRTLARNLSEEIARELLRDALKHKKERREALLAESEDLSPAEIAEEAGRAALQRLRSSASQVLLLRDGGAAAAAVRTGTRNGCTAPELFASLQWPQICSSVAQTLKGRLPRASRASASNVPLGHVALYLGALVRWGQCGAEKQARCEELLSVIWLQLASADSCLYSVAAPSGVLELESDEARARADVLRRGGDEARAFMEARGFQWAYRNVWAAGTETAAEAWAEASARPEGVSVNDASPAVG